MAKLSVSMIARNASAHIGRSLASVQWADEICVADTGSSDNTTGEAEQWGARTKRINFHGFGPAKQEALEMASGEWVLSLDSDEVVTPRLQAEITDFINDSGAYNGAEFSRVTNFCGHWIIHSGWYPEYIFRVFKRDKAHFDDSPVHESIVLDGDIKRIGGRLLHYSYPDVKSYFRKTLEYAELGAQSRKKIPRILKITYIIFKPIMTFLKKLILQKGFMDGLPGLWIAAFSAYGQYLRYYYALRNGK